MKRVNVLRSGIAAAMVLGAMTITTPVSAGDILWDQPLILDSTAFVDQNFSDFPDFSTFLVNDVVFGSGVTINSITTYYTNVGNLWPQNAAGTATLNIFADPLSGADDPMAGASVAVDFVTSSDAPAMGIVTDGVVLRVVDAVAINYRTEIHRSLVAMTTNDWAQSTEHFGYDMARWREWYNTEYLPYKGEQARLAQLAAEGAASSEGQIGDAQPDSP